MPLPSIRTPPNPLKRPHTSHESTPPCLLNTNTVKSSLPQPSFQPAHSASSSSVNSASQRAVPCRRPTHKPTRSTQDVPNSPILRRPNAPRSHTAYAHEKNSKPIPLIHHPRQSAPQPFRIADSRTLHAAKTDPTLPSNAPTPTRTKNVHPVNPPRAVRHPNHFIAPLSPHTAIPYPSSQSIPWRSQTPSPLIPKINDPGPPLSPHTAIPSSQSIPSSHLRPSPSSPAMDPINE